MPPPEDDSPDTMDAVRRGQPQPRQQQQQQNIETHQQQHQDISHDDYDINEDPLLIAQSLTYVTDDGSTVLSFAASPFSTCKKAHWYTLPRTC